MHRSGTFATFTAVLMLQAGCHKKPVAAPAAVPTARTANPPAAQRTRMPQPQSAPTPATPTPAPPQPEFRLGQSVSQEDLRVNNAMIDRHLQRATSALASIGKRPLTNDQQASLAQIRGFMEQAREMRATDVIRARSLAERADVLTQDLLARLK